MVTPSLSILVPVYNAEEYLEQCIHSVLEQSIKDFELILINDGSTDCSSNIAKKYADQDERIIYVEQPNQGVSAARNKGITRSRGDYLLFLDADDFLAQGGLSDLLQLAQEKQFDIAVGNYNSICILNGEKNSKRSLSKSICSGHDWLKQSLKLRRYQPAVWYRLYRRDFLLSKNIAFDLKLTISEDQLFSIHALLACDKLICVDIPFYQYRILEQSLSRSTNVHSCQVRVESDLYLAERVLDLCQSIDDKHLKKYLIDHMIKVLEDGFIKLLIAVNGEFKLVRKYIEHVEQYRLSNFVRIRRFSHLIDWWSLRSSFQKYIEWKFEKRKRRGTCGYIVSKILPFRHLREKSGFRR